MSGLSHINATGLKQLGALLTMLLDSPDLMDSLSVLERQQLEGALATVQSLALRARFDDPGAVNLEES